MTGAPPSVADLLRRAEAQQLTESEAAVLAEAVGALWDTAWELRATLSHHLSTWYQASIQPGGQQAQDAWLTQHLPRSATSTHANVRRLRLLLESWAVPAAPIGGER